jgi:hypothetical protein
MRNAAVYGFNELHPFHLLTHPPSGHFAIHLSPFGLSSTTDNHGRMTQRHDDDDTTKEREERAWGDPGAGDPQGTPPMPSALTRR